MRARRAADATVSFHVFQGVDQPVMSKEKQPVFRVIFQNQGQVFELYAQQIFQSELWGFMEIEELIFGERSQMLVDPK